jgi:hypothetical protein
MSSLCIVCTSMPQIIPLSTLMLVHMWYAKSNLLGANQSKHTRRPNTPRQFIVSQEHLMHEQMEKCNIHELVLHHQGHGESKPEIWRYTNHLHDQHYTKYDI